MQKSLSLSNRDVLSKEISHCLSSCLSVYRSLPIRQMGRDRQTDRQADCLSISVCLSVCLPTFLPVRLSICLCLSVSVCLSVCLCNCSFLELKDCVITDGLFHSFQMEHALKKTISFTRNCRVWNCDINGITRFLQSFLRISFKLFLHFPSSFISLVLVRLVVVVVAAAVVAVVVVSSLVCLTCS